MTGIEGAIAVRLRVENGRVAAVAIDNGRPRDPGRMFAGRPAAEVPAMLPLLFSLCGTAQLVAGLNAVEDAAGVAAEAPHRTARRLLVTAETVLEHGQRMLRDWPELIGETADLATVKALRGALAPLRGLLYPGKDWGRPGGGALAPDRDAVRARLAEARRLLHERLFAGPAPAAVADAEALAAWGRAGHTPAARMVGRLSGDLASWGASDVPNLPHPDPAALSARMAADDGFPARPDWQGAERLTHPLSRQECHPLIRALSPRCGNGALSLAAARLVELRQGLDEAGALADALEPHPGAPVTALPDGAGLGMVEAARGLLAHRVEIAGGTVARYRILAPTEWNFHPRGALAAGLAGAADTDDLAWRARLLAALLDPCVALSATIERGHGSDG